MTDAEVLLSSLLSEAPSIWLDDLSSDQDGGKNTITKSGEAETSDLFRELEQDSLLGNLIFQNLLPLFKALCILMCAYCKPFSR